MRFFILLFSLTLFSIFTYCQTVQESLEKRLMRYEQNNPMEKAYIHTDKMCYAVGDTIWFKAYLVEAMFHSGDVASDVLYVDLFKAGTETVISHKILKMSSSPSGFISLPDTLQEGVYQLRAYTNWMLNYSESFFFHKIISIFKTSQFEHQISHTEIIQNVEDISFFPEGGNLVAGLSNRVGFKAVNRLGLGVDFSGYLISEKGDTVTHILSQHKGMGYFSFVPDGGKYWLYVVKPAFNKYKLPEAIKEGYTLTIDNFSKTSIKVFVKNNFSKPDHGIFIAHQRGNIFYTNQINTDESSYAFNISKELVPDDGIVHITLFNSAGEPQCERIVYVNKALPLKVDIKPDKASYKPREKVTLEFSVSDSQGKPVKGNFSIAVTDTHQTLKQPYAENIQTYIHLTSDVHSKFDGQVKGMIEEPAYYFDVLNPKAMVHLDILLMTQGWRRFLWNNVLRDSLTVHPYRVENGITVRGQILQPGGKPSKKEVKITLLYNGGFLLGDADANGRFAIHDIDLNDSINVMVQGRKGAVGKNLDVLFDKPFIPNVPAWSGIDTVSLFRKTELAHWLERRAEYEKSLAINKVHVLKAVEVKAKRIEKDSRRMLYGNPTATVKVDSRNCNTVSNVLYFIQSRFAGVQISGIGNDLRVLIRGGQPAILLDGINVPIEMISSLSPCSIELIDIINHPVSIVYGAQSGLISILTKRGDVNYDWSQEKAKGVAVSKVRGFDLPRQFYSPAYGDNYPESTVPDLRSTIFWQPYVATNEEGKATVTFYNTDENTNVQVAIEGVSSSGKPVFSQAEYTIKQ